MQNYKLGSMCKITVCAMLGKIKEMAICDYSAPILRPFKAKSQIGFSTGLFVKLSNIMVTEKRALAYKFDHVILHMFLDADAAFDKTLHEIILRTMYHSGLQDDSWKYFLSMHKKSQTHIKWKGRTSDEKFIEDQGTRQGGVAGPQEYKFYVNPMVSDLENNCGDDRVAGHPTSVVAVADDVAPTSRGILPREALHNLQNLLYIVEDWGHQLHIKFGIELCQLLISARKKKYRQVLDILEEEPEVLTFFGKPVSIVESFYTHIGVPQAPIKQSAVVVDQRIKKGQEISYMMQDVTKNSLLGISPLANRNIFQCYHAPSYLYGLDTIHLNQTDITRLEIKFREELRRMLAFPPHASSCSVYLMIGVLPAEAMRDLDILGLLGQVAMCSEDQQVVTNIIRNNLEDYDLSFAGWSSLARMTSAKYSLPDPEQYMNNPWIPARWRSHCKSVIVETWDSKLRFNRSSYKVLTKLPGYF